MAHHCEKPVLATQVQLVLALDLLLVRHRYIKIGMRKHERAVEVRRRYTEDGKRMFVDQNRAAHDTQIVMKMVVPVHIAQHDIRHTVGATLITAMEEVTKMRLYLQCIKVIAADEVDP